MDDDRPAIRFDWTPERTGTLLSMWAAGETMKVIGTRIGTTRSAVSGRITKMGLFGDGGRERAAAMLTARTETEDMPMDDADDGGIIVANLTAADVDALAADRAALSAGTSRDLLETLSRAIDPEAADEVHHANAVLPLAVERERPDASPIAYALRGYEGGRLMASAHACRIAGTTIVVTVDPVGYLLGEPGCGRYQEWAGSPRIIRALAEIMG